MHLCFITESTTRIAQRRPRWAASHVIADSFNCIMIKANRNLLFAVVPVAPCGLNMKGTPAMQIEKTNA